MTLLSSEFTQSYRGWF